MLTFSHVRCLNIRQELKKKVAYTTSSTATGTEGAVGWIKLVCLVTYTQDPLDNLRPSDRSIYGFMVPRPLFFG